MSRRTIISLVASVIMGIGFVGTVSTDASAYYRRGVGVYAEAFTVVAITVVYVLEWR